MEKTVVNSAAAEPLRQEQQQQQQLPSTAPLTVPRKPIPASESATTMTMTEKKPGGLVHSDTGDSSTIVIDHVEDKDNNNSKEPAVAAAAAAAAAAAGGGGSSTTNNIHNKPLPSAPAAGPSSSHPFGSPTTTKKSSFLSFFRNLYTNQFRRRFPRRRTRILILTCLSLLLTLILVLSIAIPLTHRSKFGRLPLPSNHGGPYSGDLTYYGPGLGACGIVSSSSDYIVAISHTVFDAAAAVAHTGSNPNANPLCGKKVRATRNGKSVDLTVVDRCVGCKPEDLDTTTTVFAGLAEIAQGRVDVQWAWLEDVPT